MLAELHQQLSSLYRVDASHDIRDYLVTDPVLAQLLSQGAMATNTEETLLVAEDEDGVAMSLYLDADMLERLESDSPLNRLHVDHLDDFWKVLEGISHFNCMAWKAMRERSVSLLELELQGEIDKFLSAMLLAADQENDALQKDLHSWLFEATRLRDDLDDEERERYAAAMQSLIEIGAPPPVVADQWLSTTIDTPLAVTLSAASIGSVTYTILTDPASGALSGAAPDLIYTPSPGYAGGDAFTFIATNGAGDSNVATVSIDVNDPLASTGGNGCAAGLGLPLASLLAAVSVMLLRRRRACR